MDVFQDETFSDALRLALAAGMLSTSMPKTLPGQTPIFFLAPPPCYDFTNPATTKPFTILNPYMSTHGSTKTLRPPYVAIPQYAIVPLYAPQAQPPPPHSPDSVFWNLVRRTVEHSVHGFVALAWLLSEISRATPEKDLAPLQDERRSPSCDSFDLCSLPSIAPEDDLLRVDMTELKLIPSSELYLRELEPATTASATPRRLSNKSQSPPRSRSSNTLLKGYIPGEDLSVLLQILDNELYFDPEN